MQIKYLNNGLVKHVKNEIGLEMVAAGLAAEIPLAPAAPRVAAVVTWKVLDGPREGDFQHGPEIYAGCSTCSKRTWQGSRKGTAHQSIQFRHAPGNCVAVPGTVEPVPQHIVDEYLRRWTAYKSLSRR